MLRKESQNVASGVSTLDNDYDVVERATEAGLLSTARCFLLGPGADILE